MGKTLDQNITSFPPPCGAGLPKTTELAANSDETAAANKSRTRGEEEDFGGTNIAMLLRR